MSLVLYNTLTRNKDLFKPINPPKVGMYTCGPTVYNYAHIGNLRSYVFADTLRRVLLFNGYEVKQVMNITDVGHLTSDADEGDDKIEKGALREGKSVWEIAEFYTKAFKNDIKLLNILEPDIWCRATDHIKEQIAMVKTLIRKGVTYATSDGIYFDTSKIDDYGKLARLDINSLKAGKRVDIGEKRHKTDFAVWKFSPKDKVRAMEWIFDGPREGALVTDRKALNEEEKATLGFPGWHIECSAMSSKYLGEQFDIHTGGIDHIPVHHTNEIAQSETAFGKKPWVKYWLHGEFLVFDKEKMAKSGGNFLTLKTVAEKGYEPLAYRYFLLTGHYRQQMQFSWDAMDSAQASYRRLKNIVREIRKEPENAVGCADYENRFMDSINDDLNIPRALAVVWDLIRDKELPAGAKAKTLKLFDKVLGLDLFSDYEIVAPDSVKKLADERMKARKLKDWKRADSLRDKIRSMGWIVDDNNEGYELRPVND